MSDVQFDRLNSKRGEIGLILLDRTKALNALTLEMIRDMQTQLEDWEKDNGIQAVVVKSLSDKAFCAGGDIVSLYRTGRENLEETLCFFKEEYHLNQFIYDFKKPYLCLLDGITMGGGVGISLHGNYPIATERFNFAMPETGIGFFPDVGGSRLLSACHGAIGVYLGLTGKRIGVSDAVFSGLIKHTIQSEHQERFVDALCDSDLSQNAHDVVTRLIGEFKLDFERSSIEENSDELNNIFEHDNVSDIIKALSQSNSDFAKKTLSILQQKSPTSVKVTFKQIQKAQGLSMSDCMKMETRMVQSFLKGHDFYEGVRALLIDKDKSPKWSPETLDEVSDELVNSYFD